MSTGGASPKAIRVSLDAAGPWITVELPNASLVRRASALFPAAVDASEEVDGDGAGTVGYPSPGISFVIEESSGSDGEYLIRNGRGEELARSEGPVSMLSTLEATVFRELISRDGEFVHLHGAGVRIASGAALAVGPSGSGKSSIALAWAEAGRPVFGDDVLRIDPRGRVHSVRRLFKVDPARLRDHDIDPAATPEWIEGSTEAWYDPVGRGGWSVGGAPARVMVFLDRPGASTDAFSRTPAIERLAPPEALRRLIDAMFPSPGRCHAGLIDPLLGVLDGADAFRLSFDNSKAAARLIAGLVVPDQVDEGQAP